MKKGMAVPLREGRPDGHYSAYWRALHNRPLQQWQPIPKNKETPTAPAMANDIGTENTKDATDDDAEDSDEEDNDQTWAVDNCQICQEIDTPENLDGWPGYS
jgi:hypothetical protein